MLKRKLDNVGFVLPEDFSSPFSVSGYTFHPQNSQKYQKSEITITTTKQIIHNNRRHRQNAYVEYKGNQLNSILFSGGVVKRIKQKRARKFLEDLLSLGSILTGKNWQLFSRRSIAQYPLVSRNNLECISQDSLKCENHMKIAISKLTDPLWQKQFDNGFHLRMLLDCANIFVTESRFLNMVIIWEWLYPHLKNPDGATSKDEINDLKKIFFYILKEYWPINLNSSLETSNIFYILRNQLAHCGKVPIDRDRAELWMKQIPWEKGIERYLQFFNHLTQVVVLKTLGIDAEEDLKTFNFPEKLELFLKTGRIS